jgi:hypothetical protein
MRQRNAPECPECTVKHGPCRRHRLRVPHPLSTPARLPGPQSPRHPSHAAWSRTENWKRHEHGRTLHQFAAACELVGENECKLGAALAYRSPNGPSSGSQPSSSVRQDSRSVQRGTGDEIECAAVFLAGQFADVVYLALSSHPVAGYHYTRRLDRQDSSRVCSKGCWWRPVTASVLVVQLVGSARCSAPRSIFRSHQLCFVPSVCVWVGVPCNKSRRLLILSGGG